MVNFQEWYDQRKQTYTSFLGVIKPLLEILISNKEIHSWHIEGRVKEYDTFMDKILRKNIAKPEEIYDLLGLRIICFILRDGGNRKNFKIVQEILESDLLSVWYTIYRDCSFSSTAFRVIKSLVNTLRL